MVGLLARRLLRGIVTLILVSMIAFLVAHILPGNPAQAILGPEADPQSVERLNHSLGFDKPLAVQYVNWGRDFVTGDFGKDYRAGFSVGHLVKASAAPTAELSALALLVGLLAGVPLGFLSGYFHNRVPDRVISIVAALGIAVPSFWLGMVLIIIFGVQLNVLPVYGYVPLSESVSGNLKSMVLPVVSLAMLNVAVMTRFTRSGIIEVMRSDYIRTARAKGLTERVVLVRHGARNAMAVPLTVAGLIIGYTVGGVVAVEYLFSIPGLGKLAVDSVLGQEFAVLQTVMILSAATVVVANLLVDIGYQLLDPRVRVS